jgi:hypothetical protein
MVEPTLELVTRVVERLFPPAERAAALGLVERYADDDSEPARVRLAVLKLSEGRLDLLEHYVMAASRDYRDVLAWAEYPEEADQPTWRLPAAEVRRIREADRARYLAWLRSHSGP